MILFAKNSYHIIDADDAWFFKNRTLFRRKLAKPTRKPVAKSISKGWTWKALNLK
jgi:hypothetical protein